MKAYKGFNRNEDGALSCRSIVYEPGKTYKHKGKIKLCRSGFHACHELHQVWPYYPNNGKNEFWEVECGGKINEDDNDTGKFVCSEVKLIKKIDMSDVTKFDGRYATDNMYGIFGAYRKEKFFFIDKSGKKLFGKTYDNVLPFINGYAIVTDKLKQNAINTKGELVSKKWFDSIGNFSCGFFHITNNGKDNFIDEKCNLISETWFDNATEFSCGTAFVWKGEQKYEIDKNGKLTKVKDEW